MAIIDLVIIGLSLGFVVICWINSRDGNAITTASRSQIRETKLPGIDDLSIMDRIAKKSEPAVASASVTQHETVTDEEVAEEDASNEIPEFDDVKSDEPKMTKVECPNCSTIISVEEKGMMQALTCDSCGFSGELEI